MENINSKKIFLYLLSCSIIMSALMGIWAILSGEFGELQMRVLMTTLTVVGTSLLGLACGAFLESPFSRQNRTLTFVPATGIFLAVVAAAIIFWFIWIDGQSEIAFKTMCIALIFAFSLAQLSLLSLAQLAKRFQWALTTIYVVAFSLAAIWSALIVAEPESDGGMVARLLGVLGIVDAAMTVMIPIFHRLSRTELIDEEIALLSLPTADDAPTVAKVEMEIARLKAEIARLEKQKGDLQSLTSAAREKAVAPDSREVDWNK